MSLYVLIFITCIGEKQCVSNSLEAYETLKQCQEANKQYVMKGSCVRVHAYIKEKKATE